MLLPEHVCSGRFSVRHIGIKSVTNIAPLPIINPFCRSVKFGSYMGVLLGDAAANFLVTITSIFLFTR